MSGSFSANRPPPVKAVKERRTGTALVTPTKLEKMELPRMAASLHRAFNTPNAVALRNRKSQVSLG